MRSPGFQRLFFHVSSVWLFLFWFRTKMASPLVSGFQMSSKCQKCFVVLPSMMLIELMKLVLMLYLVPNGTTQFSQMTICLNGYCCPCGGLAASNFAIIIQLDTVAFTLIVFNYSKLERPKWFVETGNKFFFDLWQRVACRGSMSLIDSNSPGQNYFYRYILRWSTIQSARITDHQPVVAFEIHMKKSFDIQHQTALAVVVAHTL